MEHHFNSRYTRAHCVTQWRALRSWIVKAKQTNDDTTSFISRKAQFLIRALQASGYGLVSVSFCFCCTLFGLFSLLLWFVVELFWAEPSWMCRSGESHTAVPLRTTHCVTSTSEWKCFGIVSVRHFFLSLVSVAHAPRQLCLSIDATMNASRFHEAISITFNSFCCWCSRPHTSALDVSHANRE